MVGVVVCWSDPIDHTSRSIKVLNVLRRHGSPLLLLLKPIPVWGATWGVVVQCWSRTRTLADLLFTHAICSTHCTKEQRGRSVPVQPIMTAPRLSLARLSTKTRTSAFLSGPDFSSAPSPRSQRLGSYWSELLRNHTDLFKGSEDELATSISWNSNKLNRFNQMYLCFDWNSQISQITVLKYDQLLCSIYGRIIWLLNAIGEKRANYQLYFRCHCRSNVRNQ